MENLLRAKIKILKTVKKQYQKNEKTSGFTKKRRNIVSEISINIFNNKSLRLIVKSSMRSVLAF